MVYICAGNIEQYENCIKKLILDPKEVRYIDSENSLRGLKKPHIIFYGTYRARNNLHSIERAIREVNGSTQYV